MDERTYIVPENPTFQPPPSLKETIFGRSRTPGSMTRMEYIFLGISLLSIMATNVMCVVRIIQILSNEGITNNEADFVFSFVLIANSLFCVYYILHGIYWERPYELIVFLVATVIVLVYLIMNIIAIPERLPYKATRLAVGGVIVIITVVMGLKIAYRFFQENRLIFYSVGARAPLQKACKWLFVNEALMKLDFQLQVTLLTLLIRQFSDFNTLHIVTLAVGFPSSFLWLICGFIVMRFENWIGAMVFLLFSGLEPAYVIFVIVRTSAFFNLSGNMVAVVYACCAAALLCRGVMVVSTVICIRNFNIGLKEKLAPKFPCCQPTPRNPVDPVA